MEAVVVTLSVVAVWRLTHMLQHEEGPLGVFSRLQAWVASLPDVEGGLNRGFFCFWCLSMWVSLPFAIFLSHSLGSFIVVWLGLSGGAVLINSISQKLEQ